MVFWNCYLERLYISETMRLDPFSSLLLLRHSIIYQFPRSKSHFQHLVESTMLYPLSLNRGQSFSTHGDAITPQQLLVYGSLSSLCPVMLFVFDRDILRSFKPDQ